MGDESSRAIEMCARYIILYGTVCYIFFRPCPVHYDSWCVSWMPPTTGGRVVIKNAVFKQGAKIASSRFSRRQQQQPKVAAAGMQPVKQSRFLQLSGCCHNSISLYIRLNGTYGSSVSLFLYAFVRDKNWLPILVCEKKLGICIILLLSSCDPLTKVSYSSSRCEPF